MNFAKRHGLAFEEWSAENSSSALWEIRLQELHEVSEEHIGAKHFRGEIPFFEGRLLSHHLHRRRCFVARTDEGKGRVDGFLLCTPLSDGEHWAMEMYRHRVDSVRGVIPYLMYQAMEKFKEEGCEGVSLCPIPTIGCEVKRTGDSFLVRSTMTLWNRYGNGLFDTKGLYHYKSRFRPELRDIYLCSSSKVTMRSVWAYLKVTRSLDLKLGAVVRDFAHLMNPQRRTLVKPPVEPQHPNTVSPVVAKSPSVVKDESKAA